MQRRQHIGIALAFALAAPPHNRPRFDPPRVRQLVQDSQKFMNHGKRHRLVAEDVDHALRVTGQEPLYGFRANEHIPFRCRQCGIC